MKEEIQKYEDRYGSPDYEEGKGANLQKLVNKKEKREMNQYQFKSTDTFADKVKKIISEANPAKSESKQKEKFVPKKKNGDGTQDQKTVDFLKSKGLNDENIKKIMDTPFGLEALKEPYQKDEDQNNDLDDDNKNDTLNDEVAEKRIKIMQFINPRVIKSSEMKNFMDKNNVQEDLIKSLNEIATHKLNLYKTLIALEEGKKENKEKSKNIARQIGANAFISRKVDTMQSPLIAGREVMSNPKISSKQISDLYNKLPNLLGKSPATIVADHQALHTLHEEAEQLDNEHPTAVIKFASDAHEQWRMGFDPERTGKERIKKNSDGSEGNINVPFHELHPDWQKENLAAGYAARDALLAHPNDIEKASEYVHNEWMKRNPKADYNAHQHVQYNDLPEDEKQKDRDHVIKMQGLISLNEANRNVMRQGRTSIVKVRVRKGKVQRRKRVSAVKGYTIRGGKLKRMSMQERIRRKRGQRRGKVKRKAKMARALMRRKRSMRRRASLGV